MKAKHLILILVVVLVIGAPIYAFYLFSRPWGDRGKAYESWETSNNTFRVKITAHYEANVYLPGAFYVCESATVGSDEWREFMVFRVDDANPIPRGLFRYVNDETAYIFMSDDFVVTVDGGRSWSVWKPILPQPNGEKVYWAFKEARVEADGTGKAKLWRYDEQVKEIVYVEIQTRDYGRSWSVV